MKIIEYTEDINVDTAHISDELSDILYFDIETTGLSAKRSDLSDRMFIFLRQCISHPVDIQ